MNSRAIQDWLVTQVAELLHMDPADVDISESFTNYGLSSRDVVMLSGELEELLARRLSPTLAYEYPSILALSRYLSDDQQAQTGAENSNSLTASAKEPIAIIGMSCRFPGATHPGAFWKMLSAGIDSITEVPADRWPKESFYHPDPGIPGKAVSRWGGFLDNIDQFDPFFFGISPAEAKYMDPQQRLLLELSVEALDEAGLSKDQLNGTPTGVFVGISVNEYSHLQIGDPLAVTSHSGTGNALSIAANRISYYFNFRGPSMAIDTACSSSLAAVHLACQSIRNGECSLALAGGVNIILSPEHSIAFTKAGVLAPDGRCKAFDAAANGYVRGEGGGLIVLKSLSSALEEGDPVLAVISGSAMVQDGRTNGLMAPSRDSQERLLREAYRAAGIPPGAVQYVEAHGTGTLLGDSMEAAAIGAVIGAARTDGPCAIGSVKTNIGHLEAAAGIAGLIKVLLSIRQKALPPSLHYQSPNPHIPFATLQLKVQQELSAWPSTSGPVVAGVSSFGFGGTNVHVVVCEAVTGPYKGRATPASNDEQTHLLPLSANSFEYLQSLARDFRDLLVDDPSLTVGNICRAAGLRRSQYDFRLAVLGRSRMELADILEGFLFGEQHAGLLQRNKRPGHRPGLAFVFSGQGGQWYGMGRELLLQEKTSAGILTRIDQIIQANFNWSLTAALLAGPAERKLEEIDIVQPLIFAIQLGLAERWNEAGISPDAVIGHSMGEVAAAYVAGILSLEDAVRVICARSQRLKRLSGLGAMLATELSPHAAETLLKGYEDDISIAAVNGPNATVLSGDTEKLQEIMKVLEAQQLFCRWVKVDVASHSPQIEQLRPELIEILNGLQARQACIPIYSTVTGALADGLLFNAAYWVDNLRKPVLFSQAIGQLLDDGPAVLIEIGPHPILLSAIQQSNPPNQQQLSLLPSMRRAEPERDIFLRSLGTLYTEGFPVAWEKLYPGPGKYVRLPSIRWQKQRYWLDTPAGYTKGSRYRFQAGGLQAHPLLGDRIELAGSPSTYLWQTVLRPEMLPFIEDHRIEKEIVLPAAAYLEMAWQAVAEMNTGRPQALTDLNFLQKMVLQKSQPHFIQTTIAPYQDGRLSFGIFSRTGPDASWIQHVSGFFLQDETNEEQAETISSIRNELQQQAASQLAVAEFYGSLERRGLQYGPAFRGIEQLWSTGKEALGHVRLPLALQYDAAAYQLHPAHLDPCLQVLAAIHLDLSEQDLYVPSGCRHTRFFIQPSGAIWSQVSLQSVTSGSGTIEADIRLFDERDQLIAVLLGFRLQRIRRQQSRRPSIGDAWLYSLQWHTQSAAGALANSKSGGRNWLIFADDEGLGTTLAKQLEASGHSCYLLSAKEAIEAGEEALPEVIKHLLHDLPSPLYGIVHLWSLSIPPQSADALGKMELLGCNSALYLVQNLSSRFAGSPRLWLVTRGSQSVQAGEAIAVEQSALWGLGKVISFELPELKCTRIDLDPAQTPAGSAQLLARQISTDDREDQIAFRDGNRYVLRLVPHSQTEPYDQSAFSLRTDATYLITGGLGALGLTTAKWMSQRGARHLVLLGRSIPSSSATLAIDQLRHAGVKVIIVRADVSNEAEMDAVFEEIRQKMPALRGIIHAAGLLDDGALTNLTRQRMLNVMAPKVAGTWNLHRASMQLSLDFFVLFSSAVSVLGAPGQGNYAAASSYLDAMACFRHGLGLPAISINWGPWAEIGLAAETMGKLQEHHASTQHLIKVIGIDQGLAILELLLSDPSPQIAVLPFDLKNLLELYPTAAGMPFFEAVGGNDIHVARLYARPQLRQDYVAPRNEIERKLAELWQQTLHIDRVGVHDSFFELGGDSVLAAQILALARKAYGISINPQDAFKAFTIERLAELLEAEILRQIEAMSEEEARQRLSESN